MKDNKLIILLIILFSLTWITCKKEVVTDLVPIPPIALSADSNYLSKILFFRRNGSTIDTSITTFNYDNLKRVSKLIETNFYDFNGIITKYLDTSKYQYNNSESLPYKITKRVDNPNGIDTLLDYLFYSSEGLLIKDSLLLFSYPTGRNPVMSKQIRLFSHGNNKIYINLKYQTLNPTGNIYIKNDTLLFDINNNIIQTNSTDNYIYNRSTITNYTYGNNPSPMINLNIWNKLGILYYDKGFYLKQGVKNNLTSLKSFIYDNGVLLFTTITLDNTSIYTFKNNGYPNSLNLDFYLSPNSLSLDYIYKSL